MSLLQNPLAAVDQIDWYLDNQSSEQFPGAFVKAAGNLGRQTLEQILFILAFYGGVPSNQYIKQNFHLKVAHQILQALKQPNPTTGKTYLQQARQRSPRVAKFAWSVRTLTKWKDKFNETSHFRNPVARKSTTPEDIREFSGKLRTMLDPLDSYLIVAAVNELRTKGGVQAEIDSDGNCTPGVTVTHIIRASNLRKEDGKLVLVSPSFTFTVLSNKEESSLPKRNTVILMQHSAGMAIRGRFITEDGQPLNPSNLQTVLTALTRTSKGMEQVTRRLRRLGFQLRVIQGIGAQLTLPMDVKPA